MLAGALLLQGRRFAIMMTNTGDTWDDSKKCIEIERACGGKETETDKACVGGATVSDLFFSSLPIVSASVSETIVIIRCKIIENFYFVPRK